MKKITLYLFVATLGFTTLTSCSSDDNTTNPEPQNELIGKWEMQKMDMKLTLDGDVLIDQVDVPTKDTGIVIEYNFKTDNTVEYYLFTPATGQQQQTEASGVGTYSRNNDQITLTINNSTTYTIKLLNSNDLHLYMKDEDNTNGVINSVEFTQKFTKM